MSINSINQNLNWPAGATSLLIQGQSTTGSYTYPTSLSAGIYAVQAYSLNKDTTGAYITATANAQVEPINNGATGYINLTTTESSFTLRPLGAAPTTFTSLYAQAGAVAPNGTYSIAYGGSNYVLMGPNAASAYALFTAIGNLYSSWTQTYDGSTTLNSNSIVNYGGGKFVVTSSRGDIVVSTNGITWAEVPLQGYGGSLNFVDYANNLWIASGSNSSLYTSTDALTWSAIYGNFIGNVQVQQGIYANNKYTLVGASGIVASTTSNLRDWFSVNSQFGSSTINSIYYGNNLYVIGGNSGKLSTSTDAVTWTSRTSSFGSTVISEVTYGNGIWVAVGANGTMRTSTDAITWTTRNSSFGTSAINGVAYGAGVYVAVGAGGRMTNSTDGTTWNGVTTPGFGTSVINYITHTNGLFVAVGAGGRISSSTDGTTWTGVNAGTANLQAVTYFNGNYIVAGSTGNIWASTDLVTWAQRTSNSTVAQFTLVHNGTDQIFAAGGSGYINPSTDGVTWSGTTYGNPQGTPNYYNAAYGASKYLVGGTSTSFPTSTDAVTWTSATAPSSANTLTYGAAGFVFGDGSANTYVSTDAITWTNSSSLSWPTVQRKLTFANGNYIASSTSPSASYYHYSTNGTIWTQGPVAGTSTIGRLIYDGTRYLTTDTATGNGIRISTTLASTWSNYLPSTGSVGVAVNGNTIATASGTNAIRSFDGGTSWALFTPSAYSSGNYRRVAYLGNQYLLATATNIMASTDLAIWYSQNLDLSYLAYGQFSGTNYYVGALTSSSTGIYYNLGSDFTSGWTASGGVFATAQTATAIGIVENRVLVGASGIIASNANASFSSTFVNTAISNFVPYAFTGNAGKLYAFGDNGLSFTSTDGATWTRFMTGFGNSTIRSATYLNGLFLISGVGTKMASSTDGLSWTLITSNTPDFVVSQATNNQYYFGGGSSSISVYSSTSSYPMYYSIYGVNPNTI